MESRTRDSHAGPAGVLIVDRHPIVRLGLTKLLESARGLVCVGEAATGKGAEAAVERVRPHVIIVNEVLPDIDVLDLIRWTSSRSDRIGVVVLSEHASRDACHRAFRAGALGFLPSASSESDILRGIRCAAIGRRFAASGLMEGLADLTTIDAEREPHELLSDRELQVLRLLTAGERISEIANRLRLSIKTVSTYRARVLQKLGLPSTAHLVRYAIQHGLG